MTINLNGIVDSFNPAAEQILGKKKDDVIGHHFATVFIRDQENDVFQPDGAGCPVCLHDVGKLAVPLEIMDKATRLGPGPICCGSASPRWNSCTGSSGWRSGC